MAREVVPLSVVIPAYDRAALVERALRSVFEQLLLPAEVIVVDDGSADDTAARAASLGATVVRHERNRGKSAARNSGVEAAGHDWIALLDCDDQWLPNHLETLWPRRNGHVLIGAAMLTDGGRGERPRVFGWPGRRPELIESPAAVSLPENKLNTSTMLVRRDVVLDAGGFPALDYAEDMHLWLRMLDRGTGLVLPQVTGLYHQHDDQATVVRSRMWDARREVVLAFADRDWCTASVRARHEAAIAWDDARAALADGAPRGPALVKLARSLASPARARGLAALLRYRAGVRRESGRYSAGATPSVAVMPGTPPGTPGDVDLSGLALPRALVRLARRPTAEAVVGGPAAAAAVRALGVRPSRAQAPRRPA